MPKDEAARFIEKSLLLNGFAAKDLNIGMRVFALERADATEVAEAIVELLELGEAPGAKTPGRTKNSWCPPFLPPACAGFARVRPSFR